MSQSGEILKLRILLCFFQNEEQCTVSGLARTLGEEKYTISRCLGEMEREGLLDRHNPRRPILTQPGREQAWRDAGRVQSLTAHLVYEGVCLESARQDAIQMALYCSDETLDAILRTNQMIRLKNELGELRRFGGGRLCMRMMDGVYPLSFALYTAGASQETCPRRSDWGSVQRCDLSVRNGRGRIQLRIIPRDLVQTGFPKQTSMDNTMYFFGGTYIRAENSGGILSVPAEALEFVVLGREGCRMLHGSVCLQVEPEVCTSLSQPINGLLTVFF